MNFVNFFSTTFYDTGYIFARIEPQETPVGKDTVNIHFRITEGSAVKINKIHIAGNTKTKEAEARLGKNRQ